MKPHETTRLMNAKKEHTAMDVRHARYSLKLDETNGAIIAFAFANGACSFIHAGSGERPLFTLRFRDPQARPFELSARDARSFRMTSTSAGDDTHIELQYESLGGLPVHVDVSVVCPAEGALTYWSLAVEQHTQAIVEWIDFPDVVVPNDLVATGGSARILWPAMEGVLVEDVKLRQNSWLQYQEPGYPSKGWEGIYPGPCPTQFMAYYKDGGGLYFGAHDTNGHVKSIEFMEADGGIRLQYRLFPGGAGQGRYAMDYPMALGVFEGDWCDAAEIYRRWYEQSRARKPVKLIENDRLPDWYAESPVIVTYPVRGTKDTGNMEPNEYYPYTNGLPHLVKLARNFDSKVMALLMHWEGSAPWAPPYVWPPYGGADNFMAFKDQLHEQGHLLGVYCSGIGWTNESILDPAYNRTEQFERERLSSIMCASPEGEARQSLICNGTQRWGYDMCPTNAFVAQTVGREVTQIIDSGVDYIQYFDQNLGGLSYFCYSKHHGHPPAPGKWQTEAMIRLYLQLRKLVDESGGKAVIGCEAAAAEPFLPELMFNDMRYNITLFIGTPVPLYQYVYHEYINNFMGNQNTARQSIDMDRSPLNLLWRTAYSFAAGDMLTVVLQDKGEIGWDWGSEWTAPKPNQREITSFIREANGWRTGAGKRFLCFGRMMKPYAIECGNEVTLFMRNGSELRTPPCLTSRWQDAAGNQAQFIVNYTPQMQDCAVKLGTAGSRVQICRTGDGRLPTVGETDEAGRLRLQIAPLSTMMVLL